ncbi:MAG: radical SAM protein [Nitrospira sp.]|nr:radical SAM protein [Nitrospira sp.]PHX91351.1 MAG: radical SAM protein [Nitrospirota bacterium]MBP0121782.1 radical SAM protein [Nitrospira sp.]MBP0124615.1 radical SAM protein [Nitrospira sp.]MBP0128023.1 radical SAM protein [Nitrospira sp.]
MESILYIFLPCKKVYPIGVTYLADFIHRRKPEVRQRILDLSLFPEDQRISAVRHAATEFKPDLVCFSWRDIQIFSPHEGDSSLEHAFNFYFASNPLKRITASFAGLQQLYRYYSHIRAALSYPWLIAKEFPRAQMMIGGGAFTAFADQLIQKLPEGTIGILGEGEDAILKVVEGQSLEQERYIVREGKTVRKGQQGAPALLDALTVDLPYLTSIFPQYTEYLGESIGVQSKRGCPYDCAFCLYPYIEGKRVRYRPPSMVVKDISQHYHQWGARRFWFTDAQFITGKEAYPQCTEILERILAEKLEIEWSGYIRTSLITPELAKLMVRSGVGDLEVAITSGSQEVLNDLHMGFKLEKLYDGCRYLAEAGFKGKVILNYSLNSPKETEESLLQSVESYKNIAAILGEERVFPLMFFLGIQPNTDLEQRLLEEGYLSAGYNPLMLTPTSIRKLLYNPAPLNSFIAKACLRAWERKEGSRDPRKWTGSLSQTPKESGSYADKSLIRGIEGNSGREALLSLEEILRSRQSLRSTKDSGDKSAAIRGA